MPDAFRTGLYNFLGPDNVRNEEELIDAIEEIDEFIFDRLVEELDIWDRMKVDKEFNELMKTCPFLNDDEAVKKEYFDDPVPVDSDEFEEQRRECIEQWLNEDHGIFCGSLSIETFDKYRPRHLAQEKWNKLMEKLNG